MIKLQHHSSPPPSSFAPQRRSLTVSLSVTFSQITQTPPRLSDLPPSCFQKPGSVLLSGSVAACSLLVRTGPVCSGEIEALPADSR